MNDAESVKIKNLQAGEPSLVRYLKVMYGNIPLWRALYAEILFAWLGPLPGALGLVLRKWFYRPLFRLAGADLLIGRNVTFRYPGKISLGNNVILDDNCVVDAKGTTNEGIFVGDQVFIGRGSIVYCKNGNLRLDQGVNISSYCTLFSSNNLSIGQGTVVGGYSYLLSGGEYRYGESAPPFAEQDGMETAGPLVIGSNCWLGARVTVLDAACIGDGCVIGAGAVVTRPIPSYSVAVGVPARVIKSIREQRQ